MIRQVGRQGSGVIRTRGQSISVEGFSTHLEISMDSETHEDVLYNNEMGNEGNDGTENDVPENLDGVERSSEMSPAIMRLLIRCMGEPQNMMQWLDSTKNKQDKLAIYQEILAYLQEHGYAGTTVEPLINRWKYLCTSYRKKKIQQSGQNEPVTWMYFEEMDRSVGVRPKFTRRVECDSNAVMKPPASKKKRIRKDQTTTREEVGQGPLSIQMGHGNASFSPLSEHGTEEEKVDVDAQDSDDDFMEAIQRSLCKDEGDSAGGLTE